MRMHWLDDRARLRDLADLAHDARVQGEDHRVAEEQRSWMREDDGDAHRRGDGMTVNALEYPGLAHWLPGRAFNPDSWFHRFGIESAARQARDGLRSASAAVLHHGWRRGEDGWVTAARPSSVSRSKATELGIAHQPISAPIEVPSASRGSAAALRRERRGTA